DDVRQRVILLAELARGAELARDQSVERIEDRRDQQRNAGDLERGDGKVRASRRHRLARAQAVHDGTEAEENIQDREERRHDIDAAAEVLADVRPLHHFAPSSATTVRPTFTLSRIATLMTASAGKN